jgi:hypothetical protein
MASRFPSIATSRRRRVLAASLSSPAVRTRRASASLRRATGAWLGLGSGTSTGQRDERQRVDGAPAYHPLPTIVSRR